MALVDTVLGSGTVNDEAKTLAENASALVSLRWKHTGKVERRRYAKLAANARWKGRFATLTKKQPAPLVSQPKPALSVHDRLAQLAANLAR